MRATISHLLQNVLGQMTREALRDILGPVADSLRSQCLTSAGLVPKATGSPGSPLVKTGGSATAVITNGKLQAIGAATDMAALSGTVVNATFNVFVFSIDEGGTLKTRMGTAGATRAALKFPEVPMGEAKIGYVLINPTGTGDFVGGTTILDDATVAPNAEYVNHIGAVDPTILA